MGDIDIHAIRGNSFGGDGHMRSEGLGGAHSS